MAKTTDKKGRLKWRTIIIPFSTVQFWVSFLLVLLAVGAVLILLYLQLLSPKAQARRLIAKGEKQFNQSIVLGIKELAFDDFQSAQESLFQARKAYDNRKNSEAHVLAEQTLTTLEKAMERLRSDDFYRRERKASMSYVKGSVEVNLAGSMEWQPAKKSVKLKKGDKVRTRSGSRCVVQFDDGSQLTIKSDSLVLIDDLTEDIRTRTKNSAIKLLVSDVEASILRPTAKGSRFIIETPGSVAQVRKARMNVRVNDRNETEYKLLSGDVSVRAGDKEIKLGQSETVKLAKTGGVLSRGKLLGVPAAKEPANLNWMVSRADETQVKFSWGWLKEANYYHLAVATDRYFSNIIYDNPKVSGTSATVKGISPGLYYWRISSLDRKGQESLFSSFRVFRVIRDEVPPQLSLNDPIVFNNASGSRVYLSGAVEPGSSLSFNGRRVPLSPDGVFRSFLTVGRGQRAISIKATDQAGNVLNQVRELQ
jgi:ferric-dicitrate binding protein FerR (iron transport regulator)